MAGATVEGPGSGIRIRKIGKRRKVPVGNGPYRITGWVTGVLGFANSPRCGVRLGTDLVNNCRGKVSSHVIYSEQRGGKNRVSVRLRSCSVTAREAVQVLNGGWAGGGNEFFYCNTGEERRGIIVPYSTPSLPVHFLISRLWLQTPSLCSSVAGSDLWVLPELLSSPCF